MYSCLCAVYHGQPIRILFSLPHAWLSLSNNNNDFHFCSCVASSWPVATIPAHESPTEGEDCVFSSPYLPTIPNFFSQYFLQQNCYSVGCTCCPPSVNKENKGPPLPSLHVSYLENAVAVSFPLCFIFPHNSKLFLTLSFSNKIAIQLAMLAFLPWSIKRARTRRCHLHP